MISVIYLKQYTRFVCLETLIWAVQAWQDKQAFSLIQPEEAIWTLSLVKQVRVCMYCICAKCRRSVLGSASSHSQKGNKQRRLGLSRGGRGQGKGFNVPIPELSWEVGSEFPVPRESHTLTHAHTHTEDSNSSRWPGDYSASIPTPSPLWTGRSWSSTCVPAIPAQRADLPTSGGPHNHFSCHPFRIPTMLKRHSALSAWATAHRLHLWSVYRRSRRWCSLNINAVTFHSLDWVNTHGNWFNTIAGLYVFIRRLIAYPDIAKCGFWLNCQRSALPDPVTFQTSTLS